MSKIKFQVDIEELDCNATITIDTDEDPEFWMHFDSRGEAMERAIVDLAERLGEQIRVEFDKRDAIVQRVKELGA